jgi:hypothetical protein
MKHSAVAFAVMLIGTILGAMVIGNFILTFAPQQSSQQTAKPTTFPTSTPIAKPKQTVEPAPIAPKPLVIPKPSTLKGVSPTNKTYSTNTIELTYTVDSRVLWSYYLLDPTERGYSSEKYTGINKLFALNGLIPFNGNITLNLLEGAHRLIIAVQTEESRGSSVPIAYQTIDFTIIS